MSPARSFSAYKVPLSTNFTIENEIFYGVSLGNLANESTFLCCGKNCRYIANRMWTNLENSWNNWKSFFSVIEKVSSLVNLKLKFFHRFFTRKTVTTGNKTINSDWSWQNKPIKLSVNLLLIYIDYDSI